MFWKEFDARAFFAPPDSCYPLFSSVCSEHPYSPPENKIEMLWKEFDASAFFIPPDSRYPLFSSACPEHPSYPPPENNQMLQEMLLKSVKYIFLSKDQCIGTMVAELIGVTFWVGWITSAL